MLDTVEHTASQSTREYLACSGDDNLSALARLARDSDEAPTVSEPQFRTIHCTRGHLYIEVRTAAEDDVETPCPTCTGVHVERGVNDLATVSPLIGAQLHPTLNGDLTAADITARSHTLVWWMCQEKGHPFRAMPFNRTLNDANLSAQSLGLVEVRDLKPLRFAEHGPWTARQIEDMKAAMQPDIFGDVDETPMLIPPRFKVHYDYYCMTPTCNGHKPRILDMELSALQYHNRFKSNEELKALITQKFHAEMWNERVRTYFFVGNFADIVKRKNFSVLGVYKPPRASAYADTLF